MTDYIRITGPFRISVDDIERSSTMDLGDLGKWALFVSGVYYFYESFHDADQAKQDLSRETKNP
jgi:hypothetical protein